MPVEMPTREKDRTDCASRELRDGLGGGSPVSTGSHQVPHRFHWPRRWVLWMVIGLVVAPVAAVGIAVAVDRAFFSGQAQLVVAAGAVRGAGDRRPLRHLRRPGEPGEAERAHDRAPRGRPACVLEAGPKGCGHVPRRRPGRRRHRAGGRSEPAVEHAEPVSRHPARRPARHRAIEPARRRRDPVRDADGDGRPGRGAGGARLPAARRDRQLLRRHRGAGLPEAPSRPRCAHSSSRAEPRSTSPSSAATRSTPNAPSTSSGGSAPQTPPAGRRSQAGSASSASSRRRGTPTRSTA